MTEQRTAVLYLKSAKNDQTALDNQHAACMAYATAHDLTVVGVYIELGTPSATQMPPVFQQQMLPACKRDEHTVLATRPDRLSRQTERRDSMMRMLQETEVPIVFTLASDVPTELM